MAAWAHSAFRDRSEVLMLTLYKSLVRSKLEYCCPVWNPSKLGNVRKLEDEQRSFTKKIPGCKELSYYDRLKKLRLLSLQRRRERYCIIHVWKISNGLAPNDTEIQFADHQRHGVRASIPAINRKAQMSIKAEYDRSFRVRAAQLFNMLPADLRGVSTLDAFKCGLGRFLEHYQDTPPVTGHPGGSPNYRESEPNAETILCYTDGSKMNDKIGSGVYIPDNGSGSPVELAFHIEENSTVFQAEAYAKLLIDGGTKNKTIIINCDSQAAIKAVDSTIIKSKATQRARNELHKLGKDNNVLLRWIPAHKVYLGNEKADELANKGSGDNEAESVTLPVPRTVWKNALRQRSHRKIRERWKDMPPHFRTVWRESYTKSLSNLGKNKLRAATQYLTGHCELNYHLKENQLQSISKICPHCSMEEEIMNHFIGQCPPTKKKKAQNGKRCLKWLLNELGNICQIFARALVGPKKGHISVPQKAIRTLPADPFPIKTAPIYVVF
ncbi:hypothetical protein ACHWQZ_G018767 [Mnemiopsis leidyi]